MKKLPLIAVAAVATFTLASCSADGGDSSDGGAQELNVYAWAGEIPDTVFEAFEEETGIKVNVDNFDSNETMIAKLAAGNSGYDVLEPSQYAVQQLVGQDLIQPIDYSKIEGFELISPSFVDPAYDPDNAYSVPWVYGTTGLMYNSTCTGGEEITSWESLWDEKYKGKTYMLDNMLAAYIAGLQVTGSGADSTDEAEIAAATQALIDQKPLLAGYNSTNYYDLVASGDACIAQAWGGTSTAAAVADNDDVHYVIPEEGGSMWVDGLSIPNGAQNTDAAYAFINFLLQPEIAAMATNDGGLPSPNSGALEFVEDQSVTSNSAVYPSDEELANADFIVDPGSAMQFYQDGWTRVKAS